MVFDVVSAKHSEAGQVHPGPPLNYGLQKPFNELSTVQNTSSPKEEYVFVANAPTDKNQILSIIDILCQQNLC